MNVALRAEVSNREGKTKGQEKWSHGTLLREHDDLQTPDLILSRFSWILLPD